MQYGPISWDPFMWLLHSGAFYGLRGAPAKRLFYISLLNLAVQLLSHVPRSKVCSCMYA